MSSCCLPYSIHEGTPTGVYKSIYRLDSYITGSETSPKIVILLCDIYGPKFKNLQLIADAFAKEGYYCLCPDILGGEALDVKWTSDQLMLFLKPRLPPVTNPIVHEYFTNVREALKPKFLGTIGYCFGGKFSILEVGKDGLLDAAAVAHPSLTEEEDFLNVTKPLLINASQIDNFTPEKRHAAELALIKSGATFQFNLHGGVSHGFAVKGDYSDENVEYAANRTLSDQIAWFNRFSK